MFHTDKINKFKNNNSNSNFYNQLSLIEKIAVFKIKKIVYLVNFIL